MQPAPKPEIKLPAIHFGRRAKIAAAATVVLVVIGIAGNVYVSSQTTPEASATAYVAAVASNNADAIWSHMTVIVPQAQNVLIGSPTGANTPQLISEADLKAMLALPQNSHQPRSGISATTSVVRGDTATVSVSYSEQGQRRTETLSLLRDTGHNQYVFYPNWKVIQTAGTILINVPSPESLVAIDGTQLPKGGNSAVVLPGAHKITLLALGPFASADQNAVVQPGAYNQVSLRSVTLTPAAQTAATQAVKSYFTSCLQRTDAYSGDCPQHLDSFYGNNPVRWQLVGDPIQGLKFDADPNSGGVLAAGHSLMTAEVTTDSGTAHRVSGVPYTILLTWDGQAFQIKGLGGYYGGTQSALANPGADQSVILDAVKAGWQICLKATTFSPPDCPAQAFAYQAKDPKWTSTTDPMAGAIVNWDGSVGIYKVTGNYSVVVAYTGYYGDAQQQSLNGKYTAEVVWANQKAQLIDIKGG